MPRRKPKPRNKQLDGHSTSVMKEMREEHKKKDMKFNQRVPRAVVPGYNNVWSGVRSRPHPVFEKLKNKRKKK